MVHRCPNCSILYVNEEVEHGVCPSCKLPLGIPLGPPTLDVPPADPTAIPVPRRLGPFLLGVLVGCLLGPAALWSALQLGAPLPGIEAEQTGAVDDARERQAKADDRVRQSEAARAEALKGLEAAKRKGAAALAEKVDAERRLRDALALLARERQQAAAEKAQAAKKNKPMPAAPLRSFVRTWQLLGPFASPGGEGHDTIYPPEREPIQLRKAYDGVGGRVNWRRYHSLEDKIDLADFFNHREPGAAYAVCWVHSDVARAVALGFGSDDGARIWVNGDKVHDVKGGRQARPGQDIVGVRLKQGWNELRVKVDNILGTWEFYLEFRTADGRQPFHVASSSSPPEVR